jgi:hypothetical protein
MKRCIILLFSIVCLTLPSVVHAIEGYPGSAWGDLHWEDSDSGNSNAILEGWVRQGISWKKWQKEKASFQLTTYITTRYKWDSEGFDWNNYIKPGAGVAVEMYNPSGPLVSWGAEHLYEINYRSGDNEGKTELYMNWYHWWDIHKKGYPGSTWGDLRWEIPNSGDDNVILDGWIRQGVTVKNWAQGNNTFLLDPYVKIHYKGDSEGLDWNNYIRPGVGIALDMENAKGPLMSWGIEYSWEKNLQTGDDAHRVEVYMRWYAWWDLKHKGI